MKLGKEVFLAIVESALFAIGACFFAAVLIIPSNPVWALTAGIIFGLAGALLWSYPRLAKLFHRVKARATQDSPTIPNQPVDETYQLHRTDSYENFTQDNLNQPVESTPAYEPSYEPNYSQPIEPTPAPEYVREYEPSYEPSYLQPDPRPTDDPNQPTGYQF